MEDTVSIYKFNPEDARRFASQLGIRAQERGNELHFRKCPYCQNKTDDKNTFAISLETGQFKCLRASCGAHGNMITLARDFNFSLGRDVDEYFNSEKRYRNLRKYPVPIASDPAVRFLRSRGISREITERYHITTHKDHDNQLVFPFYDDDGTLQFIKYRKTDFDKSKDKNKEWCLSGCCPILFGMQQCNRDNKTLVITEGQIDSLSVAECGIENAVSVPTGAKGFTWVPYCWDFLTSFETVIVFGDHENGHITLLDEIRDRLSGGSVRVKHVRPEDYKDCKDANELLLKYGRQAVVDAVSNAVIVSNPRIKKLSEVRKRILDENSVIDTGIDKLNRLIGGFYPGQLIILTGERGKGKSTLGGQFILQAVKQGITSMIYSGELSDWQVQEWIDRQAAGARYINKKVTRNGFENYLVSAEAERKIHAWYDELLYIRDNSIDGDDDESLIDTIKSAVTQHGVKVLLLDNLMTAMDDDAREDIYRKQSGFVKNVARIAKAYDVIIILVVHPRKTGTDSPQNDDVAGSADITNLANTILWYHEPKKDDDTDAPRVLRVTKNRDMDGRIEQDGIPLYFGIASKRVGEDPRRLDWAYGWESTEEFVPADDDYIPY